MMEQPAAGACHTKEVEPNHGAGKPNTGLTEGLRTGQTTWCLPGDAKDFRLILRATTTKKPMQGDMQEGVQLCACQRLASARVGRLGKALRMI